MKKKAFTLLELLIVVMIVGILGAVAIPSFSRSRMRVVDQEAQSTIDLIAVAEQIYYNENHVYLGNLNTNDDIRDDLSIDFNSAHWDYFINAPSGNGANYQVTITAAGTEGSEIFWRRTLILGNPDFYIPSAW